MAFLERFKGRTSHLTKEGIVCNLTNASTPIIKHLENTQSQQYFSPHKAKEFSYTPKAIREQPKFQSEEEESTLYRPIVKGKNTNALRLRTSDEQFNFTQPKAPSDSLLYDRKAYTGQFQSPYGGCLDNRDLNNVYKSSKTLVNGPRFDMVYHMGSPAANTGKIIAGSEDPGHRMRQFFSNQSSQNSLYNREAPFYARHPSIQEGSQEVRLSKFNFIGRQEQLISKYKKRLDREEKQLVYYNPRGNHSVEKPSRVSLYK